MIVSHKYPITFARRSSSLCQSRRASQNAEIKSLWVQTSPQGRSDLGRCEAAFHSVADGVLTMRDENGTQRTRIAGLARATTTAS
jgi:hypothetical protein